MMFKNYKIVITGATSGIGLSTTKLFIEQGATVIGIGRNFAKTTELGSKFIPCECDVRDPAQIEKACAFISDTFAGELDTFVNNAGFGETTTIKDVTSEQFDRCFALLLRAGMLFGKALYPLLLKAPKKNACIVNNASSASRICAPDNTLYNLAKNAFVLYTKQQAAGFIGVRANSVSPGFIETPIFEREGSGMGNEAVVQMYQQMAAITCGRTGKPEEVADLIAFLASEDAMYINGADVLIDGGLMTVVG
ncbi:MAG: SDR family NAD(P)-dependent oxidoreductase [Suipraeoptans sp.]